MQAMQRYLAVILIAGLLSGCGITAPQNNIGFADLDALSWRDVDTTMTLSLGPTALGFAAAMVKDDPAVQRLLKNLEGVRVKIYQIEGEPATVAEDLNGMSAQLQGSGWQPVIRVREPDEVTHMLVRMDGDQIAGMTVLTSDSAEVVLVNIMGNIQPEQFATVMQPVI